ncbi:unnamed protein product [Boreogadus saida]
MTITLPTRIGQTCAVCSRPGLWLRRADGGAKTLEDDDVTLPTRILLKGEAERLGTGGLWCQGGPETEAGDQGPAAPDRRNVFLERRRAGRGAVNLEDDHHSTNKDYQESGGLTEKPYIWKANPEDHQDSTIKDSSHT